MRRSRPNTEVVPVNLIRRGGLSLSLLIVLVLGTPRTAAAQTKQPSPQDRGRVDRLAAMWAKELSTSCPLAKPEDQAAFEACRKKLYHHAGLRKALPPFLLWGRQSDPKAALKDTSLTQFAPDVWLGLYLPLFMFNGKQTVEWIEKEGLYLVRLETAFRNRLAPGQFPYPFWHNQEKWGMYQDAKSFMLWVKPGEDRLTAAQYTPTAKNSPIASSKKVPRTEFDGKWMWTDKNGKQQPQVTLFDGLFSDRNPYKAKLDTAYRDFALKMRAANCDACHVPNNPASTRRLVLLQTPAHAAGEIKRLLRSVKDDRMPVDKLGTPQPLDPATKKALLQSGAKFDSVVDAANEWERKRQSK